MDNSALEIHQVLPDLVHAAGRETGALATQLHEARLYPFLLPLALLPRWLCGKITLADVAADGVGVRVWVVRVVMVCGLDELIDAVFAQDVAARRGERCP